MNKINKVIEESNKDERVIRGTPIKDYQAIHHFLRKHYGKAIICEGDDCSSITKIYNWALRHGYKYEKKRENFIQLCRSCHAKYDITEHTRQKISRNKMGKKPLRFIKGYCVTCKADLPIPRQSLTKYCTACFKLSVVNSRKRWISNNRDSILRHGRLYARKRFGYKKTIKKYAYEQ